MPVESILTVSFRNLADREVSTGAPAVFLVGENGQGKSNFLEALYFCSYASSFRACKDSELPRMGEKDCSVRTRLSGGLHDQLSVRISSGEKQINLDGKRVVDRKTLLEVLAPVVFCHEDMEFVSGSPEMRRWFFDQSLGLHDYEYIDELRKFRKILKTRNTVLKEGKTGLLELLDLQFVQSGLVLIKKRAAAAAFFSAAFGPAYHEVSGLEGMEVRYSPSWKTEDEEELLKLLDSRRETDLNFGTSMTGPHRDRYSFHRGGVEFASRASTGQRRLLALLLRVTQARRYQEATGRKPLLLLDDVLLELDPDKRTRFLKSLPEYDQAFFTFLPEEPYERYRRDDTLVFQVENGELRG